MWPPLGAAACPACPCSQLLPRTTARCRWEALGGPPASLRDPLTGRADFQVPYLSPASPHHWDLAGPACVPARIGTKAQLEEPLQLEPQDEWRGRRPAIMENGDHFPNPKGGEGEQPAGEEEEDFK